MGFCCGYQFDFGMGFAMVAGGWVGFGLWWWMVGGGWWLGFSNGGRWIGISNGGGGGGWWFCNGLFLFGRRENIERERKRRIRLKNNKEVVKIDKVVKKKKFCYGVYYKVWC